MLFWISKQSTPCWRAFWGSCRIAHVRLKNMVFSIFAFFKIFDFQVRICAILWFVGLIRSGLPTSQFVFFLFFAFFKIFDFQVRICAVLWFVRCAWKFAPMPQFPLVGNQFFIDLTVRKGVAEAHFYCLQGGVFFVFSHFCHLPGLQVFWWFCAAEFYAEIRSDASGLFVFSNWRPRHRAGCASLK